MRNRRENARTVSKVCNSRSDAFALRFVNLGSEVRSRSPLSDGTRPCTVGDRPPNAFEPPLAREGGPLVWGALGNSCVGTPEGSLHSDWISQSYAFPAEIRSHNWWDTPTDRPPVNPEKIETPRLNFKPSSQTEGMMSHSICLLLSMRERTGT